MIGGATPAEPARAWRLRTGMTTLALAGLAACGTAPIQRAPANEQSLRDIGNRNDDAALKATAGQRGRTRAEADIRAADRREAERAPAGQQ